MLRYMLNVMLRDYFYNSLIFVINLSLQFFVSYPSLCACRSPKASCFCTVLKENKQNCFLFTVMTASETRAKKKKNRLIQY